MEWNHEKCYAGFL